MISFAHKETVTDSEGENRVYHGIMVPLYGLTDFALNLIFKSVFLDRKALISNFQGHTLSRDDKLKFIARTEKGRYLLSQYAKKDTAIYQASRGLKTYVPDWYINKDGPINGQYVAKGDIYSNYLHTPLSRDEFIHRFSEGAYTPTPLVNRVFISATNMFKKLVGWHISPVEGDHGPLVERGEIYREHLDSDLIDLNLASTEEAREIKGSRVLTERQKEAIEESKQTSKAKAKYRQETDKGDAEAKNLQREQQKRKAAEAKRSAELAR